jgi:hypothetical protein
MGSGLLGLDYRPTALPAFYRALAAKASNDPENKAN